jgi:hypothetical protein
MAGATTSTTPKHRGRPWCVNCRSKRTRARWQIFCSQACAADTAVGIASAGVDAITGSDRGVCLRCGQFGGIPHDVEGCDDFDDDVVFCEECDGRIYGDRCEYCG